ncbi:hypothetical protein O181_006154 [Austropuccinia psidii MF-1]|uniref:Uncharacterized protein n=1 Tax=Austropuccinia psidii MF-1 TaxID=1389203 RepID=A0A9Q3BIU0_9BASI|nr:hypothetical protein [Austropuccinia psidii MF-1]
MSINDSPSLLDNWFLKENKAISHLIDAAIPHDSALCIRVVPSRAMPKDFFEAIKAWCCPGSCFKNIKVFGGLLQMLLENGSGNPEPNNRIVLSLHHTFAMIKKLGIEANKLEGLLAQA